MGIPIHTAESMAAVGTEFLSPYQPHTHTHRNPYGDPPYTRQSPWLQWGRNFYPHTNPIPIPIGIPMGIPIPTAESRAAVGTEFLSPYPPHTNTHGDPYGDPHTHGRPGEQTT